jgi:hypothetical protein
MLKPLPIPGTDSFPYPIRSKLGNTTVVVGAPFSTTVMLSDRSMNRRADGSVNITGDATGAPRSSGTKPIYNEPNIVVQLLMESISLCVDRETDLYCRPQSLLP